MPIDYRLTLASDVPLEQMAELVALDTYVDVTFHMVKDSLTHKGVHHMLRTVARILNHTTEDAALIFNDSSLLLTRTAGELQVHNAADWRANTYDAISPDIPPV